MGAMVETFPRTPPRTGQPFISIIIPTRNSEVTLRGLLASVWGDPYPDREVLVIDNRSVDATLQVAEQYHCQLLRAGPERSAQRNAGAKAARGDLLLFLDADMELTPGVLEACAREARLADALSLREVTHGNGYWARVRAFERARYFRSDLFEAARCFRRDTFEALGGYDPRLTGLEDFDLHARLLEEGFRLGWVEAPLIHHEEGLALFDYLRKRGYYGKTDARYAERHPQRWREQRSLRHRMQYVLGEPLRPADLALLSGLALMRGLELVVRRGVR